MIRLLRALIVIGVVLWILLLWERSNPAILSGEVSDATREERCAEFRSEMDTETWSLGYAGRIRQIMRGCY